MDTSIQSCVNRVCVTYLSTCLRFNHLLSIFGLRTHLIPFPPPPRMAISNFPVIRECTESVFGDVQRVSLLVQVPLSCWDRCHPPCHHRCLFEIAFLPGRMPPSPSPSRARAASTWTSSLCGHLRWGVLRDTSSILQKRRLRGLGAV